MVKSPSVKVRLLALCLGLAMIFACSSLVLGYLIERNQDRQLAQQEQYHRFEVIQGTQQALGTFRHAGGQVNNAALRKNPQQERQARSAQQQARATLDIQLEKLAAFDPASARTIRNALDELPEHVQRVMDALLSGLPLESEPSFVELQRRLDLIERTLNAANEREYALARAIQEKEKRRVVIALRIAAGIIVVGSIGGVILILLVVRSIIRPLQATTEAIRRVNAGETAIDLPPVGNDEFGDIALALRQFRDRAEKLRALAYQDSLTGLGNRTALEESMHKAIARSRDDPAARFALIYLDLDNFRAVNEKLGNKGGDRYLGEAAVRIQRFSPAGSQTYRYSGDKFIILVEDLDGTEDPQAELLGVADALLHGGSEPYPVGNHLLSMSMSIGIALFPGDGETVEQLIGSAEAAVYAAKKSGRHNARLAAAQITGTARRQLALTTDIRRSLERREFDVYYQPIVDVACQRVIGAEALLRWHHPERGLLLPGEFIQVAEDAGLIGEISEHCLATAHRQVCAWAQQGMSYRVSVNLSARQAHDARILRLLDELLGEDPRAAQLIDFELTESVLFDSSDQTRNLLEAIRKRGYRLGLDDFGTGYASFSYVQRLPIDKIKIDRQFVAQMSSSRQARAIVSATLALARNLDLEVIAEGVETVEQMRMLLRENCSLQQGFLFSRAIPAVEFERWAASFQLEQIAS